MNLIVTSSILQAHPKPCVVKWYIEDSLRGCNCCYRFFCTWRQLQQIEGLEWMLVREAFLQKVYCECALACINSCSSLCFQNQILLRGRVAHCM